MLKEVFTFGGDVTGLVPPNVLSAPHPHQQKLSRRMPDPHHAAKGEAESWTR